MTILRLLLSLSISLLEGRQLHVHRIVVKRHTSMAFWVKWGCVATIRKGSKGATYTMLLYRVVAIVFPWLSDLLRRLHTTSLPVVSCRKREVETDVE